jgi:hypothetical protein
MLPSHAPALTPVIKEEADTFLSAVSDTPELWRSINFRTVAIWADGAWHNLVATAHLDARPPGEVPLVKQLPKLERLLVLQQVFPIEVLPKLIQRLRVRGLATVDGYTVRYLERV